MVREIDRPRPADCGLGNRPWVADGFGQPLFPFRRPRHARFTRGAIRARFRRFAGLGRSAGRLHGPIGLGRLVGPRRLALERRRRGIDRGGPHGGTLARHPVGGLDCRRVQPGDHRDSPPTTTWAAGFNSNKHVQHSRRRGARFHIGCGRVRGGRLGTLGASVVSLGRSRAMDRMGRFSDGNGRRLGRVARGLAGHSAERSFESCWALRSAWLSRCCSLAHSPMGFSR